MLSPCTAIGELGKDRQDLIYGEQNGFCPQLTDMKTVSFQYFNSYLQGHLLLPCMLYPVSTAKYLQAL